jgi:Fe2+ or Zn2+ uptake regulation protein
MDMREISSRLTSARLKVTPQRIAIYADLLGRDDHPSPESLYQTVKDELPRLSLATVYKTLDSLEEAGLISQVAINNETKRYDANLDSHHHLICTECRNIIDFVDDSLSSVSLDNAGYGFQPKEVKIQILGTCVACQNAAQVEMSGAVDVPTTATK